MTGLEPQSTVVPIRVNVVVYHELVSSGICHAIGMSQDIVIVGQAGDALVVGGSAFAGDLSDPEPPPASAGASHGLMDREMEVLELVAQGNTSSDIARRLFITAKTVKYRSSGIFSKPGVQIRAEAATFAVGHGLVVPAAPPGPNSF